MRRSEKPDIFLESAARFRSVKVVRLRGLNCGLNTSRHEDLLPQDSAHVFVVRLWLEHREMEGMVPERRGIVEHVPTGERRYVRSVDEVLEFLSGFLEE